VRWVTKNILLSEARPGMILARPVLSHTDNVLINENTVLNEQLLNLLLTWGIQNIGVKEPLMVPEDNIFSLVSEEQLFCDNHSLIVKDLRDAFEHTRYFKEAPLAKMNELADQAVETLINSSGVISHLFSIRTTDDYTFRHSVNVGIIAGIIGKWLDIKGRELRNLVLTGLLHDIGKTQIPLEILNKPGPLTPDELAVMQDHPSLGFELIKAAATKLPEPVVLGVWQHHERMDGHGYPFSVPGNEVSRFARIIAVADVYDAMTSDRVYRKAVTPFNVVAEVFGSTFSVFDPAVAVPFINRVKDSLIGYIVRLSDGNQARVIYLDRDRPAQPVVRLADGRYIDLEKNRELTIVEVVAAS
jgi:HD-GYP domain-containing protein (c-di-GMP phosphodiesterase class II)